jgi:hypothetical protein
VTPSPDEIDRIASPRPARFHTWSELSTVIAAETADVSGTSRNGFTSVAGLVDFLTSAERNARCRSTRSKSEPAVARVRT